MVNKFTYLIPYLKNPEKNLTLKDFETTFNKPHQTIKEHLKPLTKEKILLTEKKGRSTLYKLNKQNPQTREYLIITEKIRLLEKIKEPIFKKIYETIRQSKTKSNIILFGSSTEEKKYQDIDLLIFPKDKKLEEQLKKINETYNIPIQIINTEKKEITETLYKEIKKKHIIINNTEKNWRYLYEQDILV